MRLCHSLVPDSTSSARAGRGGGGRGRVRPGAVAMAVLDIIQKESTLNARIKQLSKQTRVWLFSLADSKKCRVCLIKGVR